jgi:assimilatory nitrate reductase catalytic subunit
MALVDDWQAWIKARLPLIANTVSPESFGYSQESRIDGVNSIQPAASSVNNACWLEYADSASGHYRTAYLTDNRLDIVLFIARDHKLPSRNWLAGLFAVAELEPLQRQALLTGMPPLGVDDVGAIVCSCFNIGSKTIATTIKEQGLKTVQDVGRCLKAGTNCGSCIAEIKALL